jgi:hypothetical protein
MGQPREAVGLCMEPNILVIGRGRSGTKAVAMALQKMELDVGHEALGRNGSVNNWWAHGGNSRPPLHTYTHVWHVVREPLANIASLHTAVWEPGETAPGWEPRLGQLTRPAQSPAMSMPLVRQYWDDRTARCAASYYEWNLECEKCLQEAAALGAHTWRFRIEDDWVQVAAKLLGREPVSIPPNINSRMGMSNHPGQLEWCDILKGLGVNEKLGLIEMARRYGYEAPRVKVK